MNTSRCRGVNSNNTHLTEADVIEIRRRVRAGERQWVVGAAFGIKQAAVSSILYGRNWGHVKDHQNA
jgi:predicted N-acyltransferase